MNFIFKSLSILSLNVRGICDIVKRKALFLFCKGSDVDIILLQKIHSSELDAKFWINQWGNLIYLSHRSIHSADYSLKKIQWKVLEVSKSD